MTTIRLEISGNIRGMIGHDEPGNGLTLPLTATPDVARAAAALLPARTRLTPSLDPSLAAAPMPILAWARAAADALGIIGLPAAVLSRSHRLTAANALMERLIPQVVQDRPVRLGLADRRADAMLGQALLQVQPGAAHMIPLAATAHLPPSVVHVFPVPDSAPDAPQAAADAAAVSCVIVITTVSRPRIASAEVLRDLFDLTPAEGRVARGIAAGKTVHDLAGEAGVARGTVRQQLKSVFCKTGVSRQADLVALLAGGTLSFPKNRLV